MQFPLCKRHQSTKNINKHNLCLYETKAMKIHTPIHVYPLNVTKMFFVTTSKALLSYIAYIKFLLHRLYYKICYDWILYN